AVVATAGRVPAIPGDDKGAVAAKRGDLRGLVSAIGDAGGLEQDRAAHSAAGAIEALDKDAGVATGIYAIPGDDKGAGAAERGDLRVVVRATGDAGGLEQGGAAHSAAGAIEALDKDAEVATGIYAIPGDDKGAVAAERGDLRVVVTPSRDDARPVQDRAAHSAAGAIEALDKDAEVATGILA